MSNIVKTDDNYKNWITDLKSRYQSSQIKAASSVNREMLMFYWSLGRDIARLRAESRWGSSFMTALSEDLREAIPNAKGFSKTNLFYMIGFYQLYHMGEEFPQVEGKIDANEKFPQVGGKLESILGDGVNQAGVDIFSIPWGHHKLIIDRCKDDREKALFFVQKTLENNWSRAVLMNFLDTNLYECQGKAISNFDKTLPSPQSDLAQEMTRDPYNFDFLTITEGYYEKELKDALMDNIQRFLLELGTGFAFVGREYRIVVGQTEQFIDMLFYNIILHCYVVIEIKIRDFEPGDMGQISTYVAAVDGILRKEGDARNKSIKPIETENDERITPNNRECKYSAAPRS